MLYECVKINETEVDKSKELVLLKEVLDGQKEYLNQEEEYLEFISFLCEQAKWEGQILIIKREEYDRCMQSKNEDDCMDLITIDSEKFYKGFKKKTGISQVEFRDCFVSAKYIDDGYNDIDLVVRVNNIEERFIIGLV